MLDRVAKHLKVDFVNIVKLLDPVPPDLSEILEAERLLAAVTRVVVVVVAVDRGVTLLVGPGEAGHAHVQPGRISNVLHILRHGLKGSDNIISATIIDLI